MKPKLSINEFIKLATFFNIMYVVVMYVLNQSVCGVRFSNAAVFGLGITGGTLLNGLLAMANWWYNAIIKPAPKPDPVKVAPKPVNPLLPVVSNQPAQNNHVSLVGVDNNPYLVPGAKAGTIDILNLDEKYPKYNIADFRFNLEYTPSALIYGSSGGGKSVLVFNLLKRLAESEYHPRFIVADFGLKDWRNSEFQTVGAILELFDILQIINRARQIEDTTNPRIVVLFEEMQMFLTQLKQIDIKNKTKRFDEFTLMLSQIIMTSRKTGACHLFGVLQNPKATIIDTNLRENLGMLFGLRSSKNLASNIMGCPKDIADRMPKIQPSITYSHQLDAFVEYPMMTRPAIDIITKRELLMLRDHYVKQYGDRVLVGNDTL